MGRKRHSMPMSWGARVLAAALLYKLFKWVQKNMARRHSMITFNPTPGHLVEETATKRVAGQRYGNDQHWLFPEFFVNPQGQWIFTRKWEKPKYTPLKGLVLVVHGFGEHCGRYDRIAKLIAAEGFEVYALDHQGHGRSEGDRAYFERFAHMVDDVITLGKRALAEHAPQSPPLFILGHSMGGLIASHAAERAKVELNGFKGCILSGPALKEDPKSAPPLLIKIGRVISRILPKFALDPLPGEFVSRDCVVVEQYKNDPLNYQGGMRARVGIEILDAMQQIQGKAHQCQWPLLLMQGTHDRLVNPEGAELFYENFGGQDKQLMMLDQRFHEILNEPDGLNTLQVMIAWLSERADFNYK